MTQVQRKSTEMTEAYKNALQEKSQNEFHRRAKEIKRENDRENGVRQAKRNHLLTKKQMKIAQKKAEISAYRDKLAKAQKAEEDGIYSMMGIILLVVGALTLLVAFILYKRDLETRIALVMLVVGAVILFASIIAQAAAMEAESKIREYSVKLEIALQQLREIESRYP